jgi:transcriptional regulator with GAF, ATPase, and Fis domain
VSTTREEDVRAALNALSEAWRVEGVTLWEVRATRLVARRIRESDDAEATAAQLAWRARGAELRQGRTLQAGETELHPLRGRSQEIVGVVQTRRPGAVSAPRQAIVVVALEQLARLLDAPEHDETLFSDVPDERKRARLIAERAELVRLLDRLRWVFTRAARQLGVTRQTVRNRVVRLRIEIPEWARHGKRRKATS